MRVIGIDPGLSGAIAVVEDWRLIEVFDVPTVEVGAGYVRRRVDIPRLIESLPRSGIAVIESVSARPGQGVASVFAFGRALGAIEAAASHLQVRYISPQAWRRVTGTSNKADSIRRAREIFGVAPQNHNQADAALIAWAYLRLRSTE